MVTEKTWSVFYVPGTVLGAGYTDNSDMQQGSVSSSVEFGKRGNAQS